MMELEVEIMLIQLRKNVALLWILRILAVPVVLVLFAAGFILNLLYGVVGAVGGLISLLGAAAAVIMEQGCTHKHHLKASGIKVDTIEVSTSTKIK